MGFLGHSEESSTVSIRESGPLSLPLLQQAEWLLSSTPVRLAAGQKEVLTEANAPDMPMDSFQKGINT